MNSLIFIGPNLVYSTRQKSDFHYNKGQWAWSGNNIPIRQQLKNQLDEELNYDCNKHIKQLLWKYS